MLKEAAEAASTNRQDSRTSTRIQILTIEQLLEGKQVAHPRLLDATFKKAPRSRPEPEKKMPLPFEGPILAGAEDEDGEGPEEPF